MVFVFNFKKQAGSVLVMIYVVTATELNRNKIANILIYRDLIRNEAMIAYNPFGWCNYSEML